MNLFLLAIISHLICDFWFQSNKIRELKYNRKFKGFLYHFLILFGFTFCLTLFFGIKIAFWFTMAVTIIHTIIDFVKTNIDNLFIKYFKNNKKRKEKILHKIKLYLFLGDQIIHIILILIIWKYFNNWFNISRNSTLTLKLFHFNTNISQILMVIIFYLIVVFVGANLIEKILNVIDIQINNTSDGVSMGKYIGIIERALILTLVTFGSLSSIGIIFTAKSLARFNKLNEKHFVEYYLLGTLSSIFIALIGGLVLRSLIH